MRLVLNIIWLLLPGLWLAIGHIPTAVPMAINVAGIPPAPANRTIVPFSPARERR